MMIEDFFIAVPFDVSELNHRYKGEMIEKFLEFLNSEDSSRGNNYKYFNSEYAEPVVEKFERVIQNEFEVGPNIKEDKWPAVYCQTNEHFRSIWHNHTKTSVINAVTYIDVPENGGHLEVEYNGTHTIKVYEDYLYIFPGWMLHRPLPQDDNKWRICVNLEYISKDIPFCKSRGIRW